MMEHIVVTGLTAVIAITWVIHVIRDIGSNTNMSFEDQLDQGMYGCRVKLEDGSYTL